MRQIQALIGWKRSVAFRDLLFNPGAISLLQLTPAQLRRAADLKEQIEELQEQLQALLGSAPAVPSKRLHWTQTPEGKARLAKSMRKTWQKRGRGTGSAKAKPATGKKLHWT